MQNTGVDGLGGVGAAPIGPVQPVRPAPEVDRDQTRPIPGLSPEGPKVAAKPAAQGAVVDLSATPASGALSRRSYEVIGGIGDLLKRTERPVPTLTTIPGSARAAADLPATTAGTRAVGGRIALP